MRISPQTLAPNEVRCPHVTSTLPVIKLLTVAVRSASDLVAGHRQEGAIAGTDNQPIQNHVFTTNWIFSAVVDVDKLPNNACLGNCASTKVLQNARLVFYWPGLYSQNSEILRAETLAPSKVRYPHVTGTVLLDPLPAVTAGSAIALPSSSHASFLVKWYESLLNTNSDYLRYGNLPLLSFLLKYFKLARVEPNSENFFSVTACHACHRLHLYSIIGDVKCILSNFNKNTQQLTGSGDGLVHSSKVKQDIYEYITVGTRMGSHSRCLEIPPWELSSDDAAHPSNSGDVAMESYFTKIQPGREGWVYVIHAEGTKRYKIGRSQNPVSRHSILQRQSPFPLKLVSCYYTLDAITDEAQLHKKLVDLRVYGEWFEINSTDENRILRCSVYSWTKIQLFNDALNIFEGLGANKQDESLAKGLFKFSESATSRQDYICFWNLISEVIPGLVQACSFEEPTQYIVGLLDCAGIFMYMSNRDDSERVNKARREAGE